MIERIFESDKKPQILFSIVFIVGFFSALGLLLSGIAQIGGENKEVLLILIGLMVRELSTIMQFWFGSSSGSKDKSAKYSVKKSPA